jgi:hypothetical protein
MRVRTFVIAAAGFALVATTPTAWADGVKASFKAKKVAGDLIPAFAPDDTGSNNGEDHDGGDANAAFNEPGSPRQSSCEFAKGSVKIQVGKNASVKVSGVVCGGTPYSGQLCAHVKALSTIANEEIDKDGNSTPKSCISGIAGDVAGRVNWVTSQVGLLTCTAGKCAGTLPPVTTDPCPDVDKITEIRRVDVMNGPDMASTVVLGTTLKACCGPRQTVVGPAQASAFAPCDTSTQDVMATMGNVTHGVVP